MRAVLLLALLISSPAIALDCNHGTVDQFKLAMAADPPTPIIADIKIDGSAYIDELFVGKTIEGGLEWLRLASHGCMIRGAMFIGLPAAPTKTPEPVIISGETRV